MRSLARANALSSAKMASLTTTHLTSSAKGVTQHARLANRLTNLIALLATLTTRALLWRKEWARFQECAKLLAIEVFTRLYRPGYLETPHWLNASATSVNILVKSAKTLRHANHAIQISL